MKTKLLNIINKFAPFILITIILIVWQIVTTKEIVPKFMLPSPVDVVKALISDAPLLFENSKITMVEAFLGLLISVIIAFFVSLIMDNFKIVRRALYPLLVISQTVPVVAIAPLLVLWFGYGIMPKILLIILVCFFPLTVSLLNGFDDVDTDIINLFKTLDATKIQIYRYVKIPSSLPYFFSGLKISASYAIVGAVISEWLGGTEGLGVYMTRVRKSYSFDKMFAVIFLISFLSIILVKLITYFENKLIHKVSK